MKLKSSTLFPMMFAAALALTGAVNASVITFSTAPLPPPLNPPFGPFLFQFDEITFTTVGTTTITVTDTDLNGVLNASFGDTFVETGLVSAVNFKLASVNINAGITGVNLGYDMFAVFAPPNGGPLVGSAGVIGTTAFGIFAPPTNATIYYDSNANGIFDLGTSTAIAQLTLDPSGPVSDCELQGLGSAQGSCKIFFDFDKGGVTKAGVWTVGGTNIGLLGAKMDIDVNVDQLQPGPFTVAYPGGPGSSQIRSATQDGSGFIQVPEPASLSLMGIALLAAGASGRRRRQQQSNSPSA